MVDSFTTSTSAFSDRPPQPSWARERCHAPLSKPKGFDRGRRLAHYPREPNWDRVSATSIKPWGYDGGGEQEHEQHTLAGSLHSRI